MSGVLGGVLASQPFLRHLVLDVDQSRLEGGVRTPTQVLTIPAAGTCDNAAADPSSRMRHACCCHSPTWVSPATPCCCRALRIRFNPAKSGSCATSFLIQIIEPGTPSRIVFNAPTDLTDPVVNRLKEGQKYIVAVIPTNARGGGQSVRKEATTTSAARVAPPPAKVSPPPPSPPPPSPPPKAGCVAGSSARSGPVVNLTAAAGAKPSTEAQLAWKVPVTGGCPVSYLVDGFVVDNPVPVIRDTPTTATSRNLTGLLPNTRYRFVITGISSNGQRSPAAQVLLTTAASDCDASGSAAPPTPINVTAVATTNAFTLTWLATSTGACAKKYLVEVDEGTRR